MALLNDSGGVLHNGVPADAVYANGKKIWPPGPKYTILVENVALADNGDDTVYEEWTFDTGAQGWQANDTFGGLTPAQWDAATGSLVASRLPNSSVAPPGTTTAHLITNVNPATFPSIVWARVDVRVTLQSWNGIGTGIEAQVVCTLTTSAPVTKKVPLDINNPTVLIEVSVGYVSSPNASPTIEVFATATGP